MNTYEIIGGKIVISSTPTNVTLFITSKIIIEEYSSLIDLFIKQIEFRKPLIKEASELTIPEKDCFVTLNNNMSEFYKLYGFFLNFSIDFSICTRELSLSTSRPEQIFFIKSIYIELYRYLERHKMHLGIIKKLIGKTNEYIEYNKSLTNFETEYYHKIKVNRNLFFAHFDKKTEYDDYYRNILKFDIEEEANMCICFLAVQQKLSKIYLNLNNQLEKESFEVFDFLRKRDEELKANLDEYRKNHSL